MKKIIIILFAVMVLVSFLVVSCSGLSKKKESYSDNSLNVYVRIEGRILDETSDQIIIQELGKKAKNRALGLMIIIIEERIEDPVRKERIISNLRSFEMKSKLLSFTINDYYIDGYFNFETKGFEELLTKYERKNNIK